MVSLAEKMASNMDFAAFSKADELKKVSLSVRGAAASRKFYPSIRYNIGKIYFILP